MNEWVKMQMAVKQIGDKNIIKEWLHYYVFYLYNFFYVTIETFILP